MDGSELRTSVKKRKDKSREKKFRSHVRQHRYIAVISAVKIN